MENPKEKVIINLRGCCALCLAHPNENTVGNSTRVSPSAVPLSSKDFEKLWSNIFSNIEFPRKEFIFLSESGAGRKETLAESRIPQYVCSPCSRKIARISAVQDVLVELRKGLEMMGKEMEGLVESVRKQMKDATVPQKQNRRKEGLNPSRFKKLLSEISSQQLTSNYLDSTVYYLGLVGNCKFYNPLQNINDQGTSSTASSGSGSSSAEKSTVSSTPRAAHAIIQVASNSNAGTGTSSAKVNETGSRSSALYDKLGKLTAGQGRGQVIQTSKPKCPVLVSPPTRADARPIKRLKLMTPSSPSSSLISHVTSSGNEGILGAEEEDSDSRTATASENEDEDEEERDYDPLGEDDNDVPVIVNVKSTATALSNSRRKQSFSVRGGAGAGTPSSSSSSSSSFSSKENKTTSVSGGSIDGCASASALLFKLRKSTSTSTPTISTSTPGLTQVLQASNSNTASPASTSTSIVAPPPPVKRSKLTTPTPPSSSSSASKIIIVTLDSEDDIKPELEAEDVNGNDNDDEMDPLGDHDNDNEDEDKVSIRSTNTKLNSSSMKRSLSVTQVMGMVKSKLQNIVSSKEMELELELEEKHEPKEEDEDFPLNSTQHCGSGIDSDSSDDSFSLGSTSDSENDMNSNDISSALNLFQRNLKTAGATTTISKVPTKIPVPKSSIVTTVKETSKITLASASTSPISKGPRVVTLKSGMTTTELDPNMTIEERLAFIKKTIGAPERQSKSKSMKTTMGVPCQICGVLKLNRQMLSHLKEAHSLGDYAFPCPNQRCLKVYFSKFSEHYARHLAKNKRCWIAAGRPALDKLKCSTCEEKFQKRPGLPLPPRKTFHSHLKNCHETLEKFFKCPIPHCNEEFTEKQSVELHLVSHSAKLNRHKSLQPCGRCPVLHGVGKGRKKLKPELMRSHLKNKHGVKDEDILGCSICPFVFSSGVELMDHWQVHLSEGKEVPCDICNDESLTFTDNRKLRDHFYNVHGIGEKYLCDQCEYWSYSMRYLRSHSQSLHTTPFVCEHCSRKFPERKRLERHIVKCAMDKVRLKCKYCLNKTFDTEAECKEHEEEVHFTKCEICAKQVLTHQLNKHLRVVHKKTVEFFKEFKCPECDLMFKHEGNWRTHRNAIHLGNYFICDKCGKRFTCRSYLQTHEKSRVCQRMKTDSGKKAVSPTTS